MFLVACTYSLSMDKLVVLVPLIDKTKQFTLAPCGRTTKGHFIATCNLLRACNKKRFLCIYDNRIAQIGSALLHFLDIPETDIVK